MGRPASDLDDYLEWQQRLENQKASGLSIDDFCECQVDMSKWHQNAESVLRAPSTRTSESVSDRTPLVLFHARVRSWSAGCSELSLVQHWCNGE
jgi:hypothetical protein